ncbi:MAG: 30S ribosomal protein S6e [Halobacteriaceae archaeon]
MATFAAVIGDPDSGHTYQREVTDRDANRFLGREIGDEADGEAVGLPGYTVEITGGSDAAGRPMREDVAGAALRSVLLAGGTGFRAERDGERRRVSVRGREVSEDVVQLNLRIGERGEEDVSELLGEGEDEADE